MTQLPPSAPGAPDAQSRVNGPAIGLMVTGGLGIAVQIIGLLMNILGIGMGAAGAAGETQEANVMQMASGGLGIMFNIIAIAIGGFIIFGAMKMKNLQGWGLAMGAAIVSMIPCISPCCLVGLPIGIWALVVLNDANVKASFRG